MRSKLGARLGNDVICADTDLVEPWSREPLSKIWPLVRDAEDGANDGSNFVCNVPETAMGFFVGDQLDCRNDGVVLLSDDEGLPTLLRLGDEAMGEAVGVKLVDGN
jgi:hypothetical protein